MPKRRPEHQPQRTCAVCRTVRPKREMQRVVRTADGEAVMDASGGCPGAGRTCAIRPAVTEAWPISRTAIARRAGQSR